MRCVALILLVLPALSYSDAFGELEAFAENGNAEAQYYVGYGYIKGIYRNVDIPKGIHFYELSAAQKFPRALYQLGLHYMIGAGVEQNAEKGGEFFVEAAKQGHERASLDACVFYHLQKRDPENAAVWCYVARKRNPKDDKGSIKTMLKKIEPALSREEKKNARNLAKIILDSFNGT